MKAILEFNIEEPEDEDALQKILKTPEILSAIDGFFSKIRTRLKYEADNYNEDELNTMEEMRDMFLETLTENGVDNLFN